MEIPLKCPKCSYKWSYKGRRVTPCCPNCRKQLKIKLDGVIR